MENDVSRTAMDVWDVFGNCGGNQQVIIFAAAFVMSFYSEMCFTIGAICVMFDVKCKDQSLEWEDR
jgi:hypothetical protein